MAPATSSADRGGLSFAGVMLIVLGAFNLINSYALFYRSSYFDGLYISNNADTWGWIVLVFAVLQLVAGFKLVSSGGGRTLAVVLASTGMMLWFMLLIAAPFMALLGTALNFSIIASVLSSDGA